MPDQPKVVMLHGGVDVTPGEPNPQLVEVLQDCLERARNGDIVGMVAAFQNGDRTATYRTCGIMSSYSIVGAMTCALQSVTTYVNRDD